MRDARSESVSDVILVKVPAVVAEDEILKNGEVWKFGENLVFEFGISVALAEFEGEGFFSVCTAVIAEDFVADRFAECGRLGARLKEGDFGRDRFVEPVICTVMRFFGACVWAFFVNSRVRIKERIRVGGDESRSDARCAFKDVGACADIAWQGACAERGAAENCSLGNVERGDDGACFRRKFSAEFAAGNAQRIACEGDRKRIRVKSGFGKLKAVCGLDSISFTRNPERSRLCKAPTVSGEGKGFSLGNARIKNGIAQGACGIKQENAPA